MKNFVFTFILNTYGIFCHISIIKALLFQLLSKTGFVLYKTASNFSMVFDTVRMTIINTEYNNVFSIF